MKVLYQMVLLGLLLGNDMLRYQVKHAFVHAQAPTDTIIATFTCFQCFRVGLAQLVGVSSSKLEILENDVQQPVICCEIIKYFDLIIAGLSYQAILFISSHFSQY